MKSKEFFEYEERAAIAEYDAGLTRDAAERVATNHIMHRDISCLKYITDYGIELIGAYDSGALIANGKDISIATTSDMSIIEDLRSGLGDREGRAKGSEINIFRFSPVKYGLLVVDIDCGHSNNIDGIESFYSFLQMNGHYSHLLPSYLQDIRNGSFPCFVKTPSGGMHLYFKYDNDNISKRILTGNVEVFGKMYITAPGSYKNGKPYILHGLLNPAPFLPPFLEKLILNTSESQIVRKPYFSFNQERNVPTLSKIMEWTSSKSCSGKNEISFKFACKARKYQYACEEVISFLKNATETRGHEQIKDAVKSAYKYQ